MISDIGLMDVVAMLLMMWVRLLNVLPKRTNPFWQDYLEPLKTSANEGERLDIRSVRSSVARRLGLPSAGLTVNRNVDGVIAVILDATMHNEPLTASVWIAGYYDILEAYQK